MKIYTKDSLIAELREIANQGWPSQSREPLGVMLEQRFRQTFD